MDTSRYYKILVPDKYLAALNFKTKRKSGIWSETTSRGFEVRNEINRVWYCDEASEVFVICTFVISMRLLFIYSNNIEVYR